MSILITGGLGYIGSHLVKALYKEYKNILIIDDLSAGLKTNHKYGTFVQCDITDPEQLDMIFFTHDIVAIFHIAGKGYVKESYEKTGAYYKANVTGTINVLNAMVKYNVKQLIFSSSCSVYGNATTLPITEATPLNPLSPYGNTKKMCEQIIHDFAKTNPMIRYAILRYFNVAGNDLNTTVTDVPNNYKRIIPTIILNTMKGTPFYVNGDTYQTKDGTCSRNYVHVSDLARAHVKAFEYLQKTEKSITCNIGSTTNHTILEMIQKIEAQLDKKANYTIQPKIDGDPDIVYCDTEYAKTMLGFTVEHDIDTIISSYITMFLLQNIN